MIRPIKDQVFVRPIFDPDTSPTGLIIIPDEAKERCDQGIVKYVGPDVRDVRVGDYVLFGGYNGTLIRLTEPNELLIVFREPWIHAILTDVDNITVNGLYYEDVNSTIDLARLIHNFIVTNLSALHNGVSSIDENEFAQYLAEQGYKKIFPATYETAVEFLAQEFTNQRKTFDVKTVK